MRVGAVIDDLMLYSRIDAAATVAGAELVRVSDPADLPTDLDLVLVDWSARRAQWADLLRTRTGAARVILFGRHTDLEAHAEARAAGLGPMWARSKLVADLPGLLGARSPEDQEPTPTSTRSTSPAMKSAR
jgi:hypothetical protein